MHRNTTHGKSRTRTYKIWAGMIQRCNNPKAAGFERYGGRGITVCAEWESSFTAFLRDMGESPQGMEIDRIVPGLGYCKENCQWLSKVDNNYANHFRAAKVTLSNLSVADLEFLLAKLHE